ncbi:OsmC family protein [Heyndrickxia acidicola]|uniref:OsmC family protein n=1 Tax=Heyndrickxia acidicola TaxID=209389 RepID=A0ABU6MHQ8_9BACI|nr:OsmC family protein [Heyndrickxia acidicola]MED1203932.1 OsmC family protein [Heyndrickxia acidicola]
MKFQMQEVGFNIDLEYGNLSVSGNSDYGFRPFQLLIASIAGCSGGVLRAILEKKRINYKDIEIDAEVEREEQEPKRIKKIALTFTISGEDLNEEILEKSVKVAMKNCSMAQSVKDSIEIIEQIKIKPSQC